MGAKIKDVAQKANVSIATVSRVINNIPLVNDETKQRVLEAIKETGYRPNAIARSLKLQKTETIGVIVHDITMPYYTQVVRGVQDISIQNGYNTIICNGDSDLKKEEEFLDLFFQKQCDGVIYAGTVFTEEIRKRLEYMNMPVILCGIEDSNQEYSCVINDYENSIGKVVQHISSLGYKDISYINGPYKSSYRGMECQENLKKKVKEYDIELKEIINVLPTYKGGYEGMQEILKDGNIASVIMCYNDEVAIGAMKALKEEGLKMPEDIALVSCDFTEPGKWVTPSLTTMNHYTYDIGAVSTRLLVKLIAGEDVKEKKILISHNLVKGDSIV